MSDFSTGIEGLEEFEHPNIILMTAHDMGQHLGCYNVNIETPNIDLLAETGVRFQQSFGTAPQCSPSRASIMTGKYPHQHGLMGITGWGHELKDDVKALPTYLRESGYSTYLYGTQHEAPSAKRLGYQTAKVGEAPVAEVVDAIESDISNIAQEAPFFLSIGLREAHRPFTSSDHNVPDPPEEVNPLPYLPDHEDIRKDIGELQGQIKSIDWGVGRLSDILDKEDLERNTLIILTTDHGIAFPRAKGTCYDPGIETALIMNDDGDLPAGEVCRDKVSHVDLFATILDYAGLNVPNDVEGDSFLPHLKDETHEFREYIFTEMTWHDRYNPMRSVRTDKYKYIKNFWKLPRVYLPMDVFESKSGRIVREEYYTSFRPREELYDLEKDPHEKHNLIDNPAYDDTLQKLRNVLIEWMYSTQDALLDGPVPPERSCDDN